MQTPQFEQKHRVVTENRVLEVTLASRRIATVKKLSEKRLIVGRETCREMDFGGHGEKPKWDKNTGPTSEWTGGFPCPTLTLIGLLNRILKKTRLNCISVSENEKVDWSEGQVRELPLPWG